MQSYFRDGALADQVWEAWDSAEADYQTACIAWMLIAGVLPIMTPD